MKIGVFDSGRGGVAVASKLRTLLPDAEIVSIDDNEHVPYGGRSAKEIFTLTNTALQPLLDGTFDTIVIACNTATTNAIEQLRSTYPSQHFVGLEPMVKPAAEVTKTGNIAVLATPATLASSQYAQLKATYANDVTVIEPDCSSWAALIEKDQIGSIPLEETIALLKNQAVDVIVLACTHYHWLEDAIKKLSGESITVLEPTDAIRNRILDIIR